MQAANRCACSSRPQAEAGTLLQLTTTATGAVTWSKASEGSTSSSLDAPDAPSTSGAWGLAGFGWWGGRGSGNRRQPGALLCGSHMRCWDVFRPPNTLPSFRTPTPGVPSIHLSLPWCRHEDPCASVSQHIAPCALSPPFVLITPHRHGDLRAAVARQVGAWPRGVQGVCGGSQVEVGVRRGADCMAGGVCVAASCKQRSLGEVAT